ncbi:major facilitator superfamily domain-containing protein [Mariannaea sp. PMI_226]|nr:major facilitator superfamily domain-containing protein [Mariannaea sp. PMI_226]
MSYPSQRRVSKTTPSSDETTPLLQHDSNQLLATQRDSHNENNTDVECAKKPPPVSWMSMPQKGQLAVIVFARLAEPLSERSLTSYIFYQLQWFNSSLEPSEIAKQAGQLTAVFAGAQCVTAMFWGRAADNPFIGRKLVLLIGLTGAATSAIGMGFAPSFHFALLFRFTAGALNGNVGVLRTMISEIIPDKRYKSRAFLLLPMCFNVGIIIGPLMSGFLADPVHSLPGLFGPGSFLGGANGVQWMERYPYALPNLVCASVLITAAIGISLGLDETHPALRHRTDIGRWVGKFLLSKITRKKTPDYPYGPLTSTVTSDDSQPIPALNREADEAGVPIKERTRLRDLFTKNVCLTLFQHFLRGLHTSAFNSVFFSLLPTPRADNSHAKLPFRFTGGLGLSSKKIGLLNTIIGGIGLPLQIFIYPRLSHHFGPLASYRAFLPLSLLAYCLIPYLVLLPDNLALVWTGLTALMSMHVIARVFVTPASIVLVNESAPTPTLLGTVHGIASSTASGARIFGPTIGGNVLGWGLAHNFVGIPMWGMALVGVVHWLVLWQVEEISSH